MCGPTLIEWCGKLNRRRRTALSMELSRWQGTPQLVTMRQVPLICFLDGSRSKAAGTDMRFGLVIRG